MKPLSVLIAAKELPFHDRSSGNFRLFQIIRLLVSKGHAVTFLARPSFREIDETPYIRELEQLGVTVLRISDETSRVTGRGVDTSFDELLATARFDAAYLMFYSVAELYLDRIRVHSPATRIIVDSVDIHFLREQRQGDIAPSGSKNETEQNKMRELEMYRRANMVIVLTDVDRLALLAEVPYIKTAIIPNIHPVIPSCRPGYEDRRDIVFVGGFTHAPNVDAVEYFCSEVWPEVSRRLPECRLIIAGNAPPARVIRFASERVLVTGFVEDLAALLDHCLVSIAPLRFGAGMKGKVGEALAYGLPVVATSIGAEGMGLTHGEHLLVADTPRDFADCLTALYGDRELWARLSTNGKAFIERNFSPNAVSHALDLMLDALSGAESVQAENCNAGPHRETLFAGASPLTRRTIAIKCCTPSREKIGWGDTSFADALARAFERLGYACRVDCRDEWYTGSDTDMVIHLKGLYEYTPSPSSLNIIWIISHPELVTVEELNSFDVVFCASQSFSRKIGNICTPPVHYLPQASEPDIFKPAGQPKKEIDLLFVGNNYEANNGGRRKIIEDLLKTGKDYNYAVVGQQWRGFVDDARILGDYVEPRQLPLLYSMARIVLNDHHREMRREGFINNRTFDLALSHVFQISDSVDGIEKLGIETYSNPGELKEKIDFFLANERARLSSTLLAYKRCLNFTFGNRATKILSLITNSKINKMPPGLPPVSPASVSDPPGHGNSNPTQINISSFEPVAVQDADLREQELIRVIRQTSGHSREKAKKTVISYLTNIAESPQLAQWLKEEILSSGDMLSPNSDKPVKVSIIIPCHNYGSYLRNCVLSVLRQSYSAFEIIIVNDGSTDETDKAAREILADFEGYHIRYFSQENRGIVQPRNFGVSRARGDFILPLDADDLLAPSFLERTVFSLESDPDLGYVSTKSLFFGISNKVWPKENFSPANLLVTNQQTNTTLYRKTMWTDIGGYDERMNDGYVDWEFWIRATKKGWLGIQLDEPLFLYYRKNNSVVMRAKDRDRSLKLKIIGLHPEVYCTDHPLLAREETLSRKNLIPPELVREEFLRQFDQIVEDRRKRVNSRQMEIRRETSKILFVCHDFPPYRYAGAQLYAFHLAKELTELGHDVRVLYPVNCSARGEGEDRTPYRLISTEYEGIPVYQINVDDRAEPFSENPQFCFSNPVVEECFRRFLREEGFHLVHYHLLYRLSAGLPLVTRELGIFSFATLHDYWLLCAMGHLIDTAGRECAGPESPLKCATCLTGFQGQPPSQIIDFFARRNEAVRAGYDAIDCVLSPSSYLADAHERFALKRPAVLPLGWLPVAGSAKKTSPGKIVFGYLGQIIARKGLDLLVEALLGIPETHWELKIHGEIYDRAFFDGIRERIGDHPAIKYLGPYTAKDLPELYSDIDVAIIPSRKENYPLTLLESLSTGTPVIASDVGGVREMMEDGREGLVFPMGDVKGLRDRISLLLNDPVLIHRMGEAIRPVKTIRDNAREMDMLYREVPAVPCRACRG